MFRGRACVFLKGLKSSPAGLFEGQQRKSLLVVQVCKNINGGCSRGPWS